MARISFGSRAGDVTDYGGGMKIGPRHARSSGPHESLDALTNALAAEFQAAASTSLPSCTTIELSLSPDAIIPLVRPSIGPYAEGGDHDLPPEFKQNDGDVEGSNAASKIPRVTCSAIINITDARAKQIVQRAASRGVMTAIEALDGFRYSFNNAWTAKDEEGARFSFICQDSMQNKDRHANGYTRILKHLKKDPAGAERGPRKPTYDCKGSVSVKFSASRQACDVYYRHNAIHDTVAARKPANRVPSGPTRSSSAWIKLPSSAAANLVPRGQEDTGGLFAMLQAEGASMSPVADSSKAVRPQATSSNIGRPLKRKREEMDRPAPMPRQSNHSLSLADLLRQSETAKAPPPSMEPHNTKTAPRAAAVAYELPSWQAPPPPLNRPPEGLPYQLPYPPRAPKTSATAPTPRGPTTPMTPIYPKPPQNPPRARGAGAPPAPQGLFTTMKVVEKPPLRWHDQPLQTPVTIRQSPFITPSMPRCCTNCRLAKRRCDGARPVCSACSKSARADCRYEGPPHRQPQSGVPQSAPTQTNLTGAQNLPQLAPKPDTSIEPAQPMAHWSQGAPPSSQQAPQAFTSVPPSQQQFSQTAAGSGGSSAQQPSLSDWSQDSTAFSSWTDMSAQGTNAQQWPSQDVPPLPAWGSLGMASSSNARPQSPDPWFPKRG